MCGVGGILLLEPTVCRSQEIRLHHESLRDDQRMPRSHEKEIMLVLVAPMYHTIEIRQHEHLVPFHIAGGLVEAVENPCRGPKVGKNELLRGIVLRFDK